MGSWVRKREENDTAVVRLICLPHAGSGAAGFFRWKRMLQGRVEICPVLLPGRESRLDEPCAGSVGEVVEALLAETWLFAGEYAIFGHSMGALLAYELARAAEQRGFTLPRCLFLSGRGAPRDADCGQPLHELEESAFLAALAKRYGPAAAAVLDDAEMRALFLPILRADLRLVETYRHRAGEPMMCNVIALAGAQDRSVTDDELAAWRDTTRGSFRSLRLPGDHYYSFGAGQDALLQLLAETLQSPDGTIARSR